MSRPYFIIPDIERFPEASGEERTRLARRIAAAVGDPAALRAILGVDPAEFASFYPDMVLPDLSTGETIDAFIDRFSDPSRPMPTEVEDILPPPGTPVYSLDDLEALPEIGESEDIPAAIPHKPVLSESLVKVMFKSGNYQKALEIITELSQDEQKKSIYSADQIRFLKNLIACTSRK